MARGRCAAAGKEADNYAVGGEDSAGETPTDAGGTPALPRKLNRKKAGLARSRPRLGVSVPPEFPKCR
jgi:hypothetical protein